MCFTVRRFHVFVADLNKLIYYCKHISGRRAWTRDDIPETDVIVTQEMNITATTNIAFFSTQITEAIDFSEVQFKNQK